MKKEERGDIPCADCGTEDNANWSTENVFWNAVMGRTRYKILCINCFTLRAEKKFNLMWRIFPEWKWQKRKNKPKA